MADDKKPNSPANEGNTADDNGSPAGSEATAPIHFNIKKVVINTSATQKNNKERGLGNNKIPWRKKLKYIGIIGPIVVTVGLLIVAIFQLIITKEALVVSNRAWIEPMGISIESGLEPGQILTFDLVYANIGRQPARNVVIQTYASTVEPPQNGDWYAKFPGRNETCSTAEPNKNGLVVYPSSKERPGVLTHWTKKPPPQAEAVWNGTRALVFEGCIGYETFEAHYSAFCFYIRPVLGKPPDPKDFFRCLTHNHAT